MAKITEVSDAQLLGALRKYQRELQEAADGASAERARRFLVQIEAEQARRAAPAPAKVRMERPQPPVAPKPAAAKAPPPAQAAPLPSPARTVPAAKAAPASPAETARLIAAVKATPAARAAAQAPAKPKAAPAPKRKAAARTGDPLAALPPWTGSALTVASYVLGVAGVLLLLDYWVLGLFPGNNWYWMITMPLSGLCYKAGSWMLDRHDRDAMPGREVVEIT